MVDCKKTEITTKLKELNAILNYKVSEIVDESIDLDAMLEKKMTTVFSILCLTILTTTQITFDAFLIGVVCALPPH